MACRSGGPRVWYNAEEMMMEAPRGGGLKYLMVRSREDGAKGDHVGRGFCTASACRRSVDWSVMAIRKYTEGELNLSPVPQQACIFRCGAGPLTASHRDESLHPQAAQQVLSFEDYGISTGRTLTCARDMSTEIAR